MVVSVDVSRISLKEEEAVPGAEVAAEEPAAE
jgi:hypothetical protein